jgi:membrane protease YdiL (CAAX protease family)
VSENNWLKQNGYFRIGSALLLVIGIALLFQAFGAVLVGIYAAITHTDLKHLSGLSEIVTTGIAQLVVMLLGSALLVRIVRQDPIRTFRLQGFYETPAMAYVLAIPLMFAAQLVGSMFAILWEHVLKQLPSVYTHIKDLEKLSADAVRGAMGGQHSILDAVLLFVTIAIVPAFSEELVFRGFMQTNIELSGKGKSRPYVAILWTSLAFAAIHFEPIEFPGLFVLGLVLGWMSYRTGNLFVGSVGHIANNGAIVMVMLLVPNASEGLTGTVTSNVETSISQAVITLAFALPMLVLCGYGFHRVTMGLTARNPPVRLFNDGSPEVQTYYDQLHDQ